jgi:hypothetical protein
MKRHFKLYIKHLLIQIILYFRKRFHYKLRLEKWSIDLLGSLLPRHLELIYLINFHFLDRVSKKYPDNYQKM